MMQTRRFFMAVAALGTGAGPAWAQLKTPPAAMSAKWYAVQVEDLAFQVEMPGIPDNRRIDDRSAKGTPFVLFSYSLEVGATAYVVQTAVYPADVDARQPRPLLQAALDARAQPLAGRTMRLQVTIQEGHVYVTDGTLDLRFEDTDSNRMIVINGIDIRPAALFGMGSTTSTGTLNADGTTIDSFTIAGAPANSLITVEGNGMMGVPGKCPWKKSSATVTFLTATSRRPGSCSTTASTSTDGNR